jgi:hypothetical protein
MNTGALWQAQRAQRATSGEEFVTNCFFDGFSENRREWFIGMYQRSRDTQATLAESSDERRPVCRAMRVNPCAQ